MTANQKKIIFIKLCTGILFFAITAMFSLSVSADTAGEKETNKDKNNVYNLYDAELGKVMDDGSIYNKYGTSLGYVDEKGIIQNAHKVVIGKVEDEGTVRNQAGTKLGTVNIKGEIFSVSDRKMGSVKGVDDIKLIGGAARLLLFKTYSRRRK
jgi:hypothetical protein